jgi:hypothetical protein
VVIGEVSWPFWGCEKDELDRAFLEQLVAARRRP